MVSAGVRRSGRVPKEIAILLSGSDTDGLQFSERTKTILLSKHGASLLSRYKLVAEQEVFLRTLPNNREIEVRVCGEIGEREDGHIYGVAFVDPKVDFWGMDFPPGEKLTKSLIYMTLECPGCKERTAVQFDAMEMDVYTVNEGVLRYCKRCLTSTVWKRAIGDVPTAGTAARFDSTGSPAAGGASFAGASAAGLGAKIDLTRGIDNKDAAAAQPESLADWKPEARPALPALPESVSKAPASPSTPGAIENRRRDRRTKVRCSACIRSLGAKEEVVECMDMSRGGFSFSSSRQYSKEATIEVAVPYTPGTSIFVPAQIVNVRELQKGKLFRYGAAYRRRPN